MIYIPCVCGCVWVVRLKRDRDPYRDIDERLALPRAPRSAGALALARWRWRLFSVPVLFLIIRSFSLPYDIHCAFCSEILCV